jgi:hypothetical protein
MSLTAIALSVLASTAQTGSTEAAAAQSPPARARRVCRVQERLGTILPRRVCRSEADWAQIDGAQDRITTRDTMHMRNNSRGSLAGGQGPD